MFLNQICQFWIGDNDVNSEECKSAISNKCYTPVQSLRCYNNSTVIISPSMFNCPLARFFCFANIISITTRTIKTINNKRITQSSCFIFDVAIKLNFINIILSLESNGTSFHAIRSNFAQARLEWRKPLTAIIRHTNVNGQYLRGFSIISAFVCSVKHLMNNTFNNRPGKAIPIC